MFQHQQGTLSVHATRVSWRKHSRQTRCLTSSTSRSYRHSGLAEARLSSHAPRNCAGVLYASPTEAHTHEFKLCAWWVFECSGRGVSVTVTQQREKREENSAFAFMPSFILSCLFYVPALAARPWGGSEGWGARLQMTDHTIRYAWPASSSLARRAHPPCLLAHGPWLPASNRISQAVTSASAPRSSTDGVRPATNGR